MITSCCDGQCLKQEFIVRFIVLIATAEEVDGLFQFLK
jgi:hypothetical protein